MIRIVTAILLLAGLAPPQEPPRGGSPPGPGLVSPIPGDKIAWYGTLEQAREDAGRTGKPILLLAAAPHCHNISGVW